MAIEGKGQRTAPGSGHRIRVELGCAGNAEGGINEEAECLQRDMSAVCDASMPRSIPGGGARNRCVYWWTEEIAELRRIQNAKARSCMELVESVESDPSRRPY
jgi:hypothetical protein